MNKKVIYELDWNAPFDPLYGAPITIPENTIIWRGYDVNFPAISERYAYYSSYNVALGYAKKNKRKMGCFITTRPLQILDIRFMNVLLSRLIHTNDVNKNIESFAAIMLSFGLCSLENQIKLLKLRYKGVLNLNDANSKIINDGIKKLEEYNNPDSIIEYQGVRIAETSNDGYTMTFLQELFKGYIDGFISPKLFTPFHDEKNSIMSPELILFDPMNSNIKQINYPTSTKIININELIGKHHGHIVLENKKLNVKMKFFMIGGGNCIENHPVDSFNTLLEQENKDAKNIYNKAKKEGKKFRESIVNIYKIETPTITVPISPFSII
jgi:hypothetical protein